MIAAFFVFKVFARNEANTLMNTTEYDMRYEIASFLAKTFKTKTSEP